jgi:hypothetical protein
VILNFEVLADFAHFRVTALSDPTAEKLLTLVMLELTCAALVTEVIPRKPMANVATVR